jgi:hypothetical protein
MSNRNWARSVGLLSLGLVLTLAGGRAGAQAADEGVQVQARGPVHEAFAEPSVGQPRPFPIIPKQPPDPVDEVPPDQKPEGDNVQWVPGYWAYDEDSADFLWVSGCWRAFPPGRQWMPGHWAQVENGWQWVAGFWAPVQQPEANLAPPPPATIDTGPSTPAPGVQYVYVPGVWVYRERRYSWRPGFWYLPRPGWVWVPARYVWTPGGFIFVEGYWDYPLQTRGLLFAPVVIERRYWGRPNWFFRPRYVVPEPALVAALFVRPDWGCYYFGDYFEVRYRRLGFVTWVDYRVTRYSPDPLYNYYRWRYRDDRLWDRNLRTLYVDRLNGTAPRPPRTLVQQNTLVKNVTVNNITNVRNVTVLAPITQVDKTIVKVRPVSPAQLAQERQAAAALRAASVQRQKIDAQLAARGPAPTRPTDPVRVPTVQLPRVAAASGTRTTAKPPAPPALPKGVEKALPPHDPVKPLVVPQPKGEVRPAPRPDTKPAPPPPPKPDAKPAPKPPPKTDAKPVLPPPKTDVKPPPKTDGKPPPKPESRPVIPPPPKPTTASPPPMPRPDVKPQPKPDGRPAPQPPKPTTASPPPMPKPSHMPPSKGSPPMKSDKADKK